MWISNVNNFKYNIEDEYDKWILKANSCIQDFGFLWSIDRSNIHIKESNDILYKKYGSYTYEEIKKIILDKYDINEKSIDEAINSIKEMGDCVINDITGGLAREIIAKDEEYDDKKWWNIKKDLEDLFHNVGSKSIILGIFDNSTKTITLYVNAINQHANNLRIPYIQALEVTFIHELFHAFHHKNNNIELVNRWDYTSQVVKESLASYFEYRYCIKYNYLAAAKDLDKSWLQYSVYCYPYSGALSFKKNNCNFKDIFDISLTDMDGSLRQLLHAELFYKIKNKVEIVKTIINVSQPQIIMPSKGINKVYVCKNKLSYDNEKNGGYLSAPDMSRYNILKTVQPGDVIFHIFKNQLHAVSIAQSGYYMDKGSIYVDSQYYELNNSCDISILKSNPNYPNKKGDTHYLLLCSNYTILNNIVDLVLMNYPKDSFFLTIKNILN